MGNVFKIEEGSLVRRLVCCANERLLSRIIPRSRMDGEGDRIVLSMVREKFWVDVVSDFEPMSIISDLSQVSLRKFVCSHVCSSDRQLLRVERVAGVMDFVEM